MNFLLSEEQVALVDTVASLLRDKCEPLRVHKMFDVEGDAQFDAELWQALVEMGLPGIIVPEEFGGLGLGLVDLAIVSEALGAAAAPIPFFGHAVAGLAISLAGTEEQKAKWLPRIASGEILATVAFAEGKNGWFPDQWQISASGGIEGTKQLVPNAAEADLIVVGVSEGLAVVEKGASFTTRRIDGADRTRPMDEVTFNKAAAEVLGQGAAVVDRVIDAAAVLLSADAFGGAEHCVDMCIDYAKVREQYGQLLAQFQGYRYQLVKMALATEPSRGLYWFAAYTWDSQPEQSSHAASQAKAHLTDTFLQITRDTVEAHGGIGFTWEHDTHIYMKRAMLDWAWLGSPSRHRLRAADLAGW